MQVLDECSYGGRTHPERWHIRPEASEDLRQTFFEEATGPSLDQFARLVEWHLPDERTAVIGFDEKNVHVFRRCRWRARWERIGKSLTHAAHHPQHQVLAMGFQEEEHI